MSHLRPIAALTSLLMAVNASAANSDEAHETAVELLAAFSGTSAQQHAPYFQYSEQGRIVDVEVHSVGMDNTTARYSGQEHEWYEANNILRITTADGLEGVSGVDRYYPGSFGDQHLQELQSVAGELMSLQSLDPIQVSLLLKKSRPDLSNEARASIDIALWDLAARKAKLPLHQLLGSKRNSMETYASLPFYDSLPQYIEAVHEYASLGYSIFKFHVWGSIEEDLELVKLVQQTFAGSDFRFMIDLESRYEFDDALRLGQQMDQGLFIVFEAPVDDAKLEHYAALRSALSNQVIPAGYNIYSPEFIRQAIELGAWDQGRFDATVVGGISQALELLIIANEADLPIDIQSWGHSLAQAANLHLMLANERTRYFEAPMPKQAFEFGMKNGNFMNQGRVLAPAEPGLGVEVDWSLLPAADFYSSSR